MRLSVFYDHILEAHGQSGKSIPEILRVCHSLGIDGIEIEYTLFSKNRESITSMLSGAGMSVSCFYEFYQFQKNSDLSWAKQMLQTAAELKVPRVLAYRAPWRQVMPRNFVPAAVRMKRFVILWTTIPGFRGYGRHCPGWLPVAVLLE